jgi:hypothetical protein
MLYIVWSFVQFQTLRIPKMLLVRICAKKRLPTGVINTKCDQKNKTHLETVNVKCKTVKQPEASRYHTCERVDVRRGVGEVLYLHFRSRSTAESDWCGL